MSLVGLIDHNEAAKRDIPAILPLKFWTEHTPAPTPAEPGKFIEADWVLWARKGQNGAETQEKISRIKKPGREGPNPIWLVIQPAYERWKAGQEDPTEGTPLSVWPGVTTSQADHLRILHIRSVEDVAVLTDADCERVGMGARALRAKAQAFIRAQEPAAAAAAITARDDQIANLTAMVADLTATVKELTAGKTREKPADMARNQRGKD